MDQIQIELNLFPIKEVEVDGVQMGVLSDGSPYLTARGLARMCGVDHTLIIRLANNWDEERTKPRGRTIMGLLIAQGGKGDHLYRRTRGPSGETHAYTDAVCMALLEYYAFEAQQGSNETALRNYRLLARHSFRSFIYQRIGYDPSTQMPDAWRNFHERVILNDSIPADYFTVFREIADLVVHMIRGGFPFNDHCIPDISVGLAWSRHWTTGALDVTFGKRRKHPHRYPKRYPQSAAGPVDAWIYPVRALGEFRVWLYKTYVPVAFPKYLAGKIQQGTMLPTPATRLIEAVSKKNAA